MALLLGVSEPFCEEPQSRFGANFSLTPSTIRVFADSLAGFGFL